MRQRVVVEHRIARLVQLGIRQARYCGRPKTLFQVLMAATVANLTLVGATLARPMLVAAAAAKQTVVAAAVGDLCRLLLLPLLGTLIATCPRRPAKRLRSPNFASRPLFSPIGA